MMIEAVPPLIFARLFREMVFSFFEVFFIIFFLIQIKVAPENESF